MDWPTNLNHNSVEGILAYRYVWNALSLIPNLDLAFMHETEHISDIEQITVSVNTGSLEGRQTVYVKTREDV